MAEQVKDLYAILELEKTATDKEIKASYRKLAAKYHPDVCHEENAQELFQRITEAYEVLSDPDARKEYDDFAEMMKEGKSISFKDLYSKFHNNQPGSHAPIKGDDVEMKITFSVFEVRQGLQKQIRFDRYSNCDDCHGHGFHKDPTNTCRDCNGKGFSLVGSKTPFGEIKTESQCRLCKGKGYVNIESCATCKGEGKKVIPVMITFPIPKETTDNHKVILKGKGDTGLNGGRNGDLIVTLVHDPEDPFEMENDYDLKMRLDVPFVKSLTGGQVSVTLPRGEVMNVTIPRGTQTGDRISVPDEGLFNPNNGFYGTVTLHVNILVPSALSEDAVKKLIGILG